MHITHDIHTHNLYSGCCSDPLANTENCVRKAMELGHTVFGISNHLWDESVPGASAWYRGQPISYGAELKYAIPKDTGKMRVLFGTETEYCAQTDTLGMRAEHASVFDYVLVPHSHTHMRNFVIAETQDVKDCRSEMVKTLTGVYPELSEAAIRKMVMSLKMEELLPLITHTAVDYERYLSDFLTDSLYALLRNPEFCRLAATVPTVIAHPLAPSEGGASYARIVRGIDREKLWQCCRRAAELHVAFDVNIWTFHEQEYGLRDNPMVDVMQVARQAGILFSFGTDSHTVEGLSEIRKADAIADAIGIEQKNLMELVR